MKKFPLLTYIFVFTGVFYMMTFYGCAKKMTMEKITTPSIAFGSSGGFTNLTTEYHLLEDGKIVQKSKDSPAYNVLMRVDKINASQIFANAKMLGLDTMQFNEPGNLYYFLTVRNNEQSENKIIWGSHDTPAPTEVKNFYQMLVNLLPKSKEAPQK